MLNKVYALKVGNKLLHVYMIGSGYEISLFEENDLRVELFYTSKDFANNRLDNLKNKSNYVNFYTEEDIINLDEVKVVEYNITLEELI